MASKLIIEPEAQEEISEAIEWYERKQVGLGSDFLDYLDGYFLTLKNGNASFEIKKILSLESFLSALEILSYR